VILVKKLLTSAVLVLLAHTGYGRGVQVLCSVAIVTVSRVFASRKIGNPLFWPKTRID
jgi:hypothetical protein